MRGNVFTSRFEMSLAPVSPKNLASHMSCMYMRRTSLVLSLLASSFALRPAVVSRRALCSTAGAFAALRLAGCGRATAAAELTYEVLAPGDQSSPVPARGQKVAVDYTLWLNSFDGKVIDSSKGSAFPPRLPSPFVFSAGVGEVIPGWDKAVRTMHVGEKRRLVVPSALAYGDKGIGPIPGGATLYFEVELLELRQMPKFSEKQLEWLAMHPEP